MPAAAAHKQWVIPQRRLDLCDFVFVDGRGDKWQEEVRTRNQEDSHTDGQAMGCQRASETTTYDCLSPAAHTKNLFSLLLRRHASDAVFSLIHFSDLCPVTR